MTVVGADACPAGWFATVLEDGHAHTDQRQTFEALYDTYETADRILVDIPIGLPTDERRRCDVDARDLLGCRGNSVFYPPSEKAIEYDDYATANKRHRDSTDNGLSQQAFHIRKKIREVRDSAGEQYDETVRESHPELCFAALNKQPIAYPKSSDRGKRFRMELLSEELNSAPELYRDAREEYLLKEVRRDDILDAMVLAVAAQNENLSTVPSDPAAGEPRIYYPPFEIPATPLE